MSLAKPSDYQVRLDAVDATRSFLVQAPAGSGKTELLTDRILALLAIVQQPEEIVAITFTRAAAAEMHARVIEKLQLALEPEPSEPYKKNSWLLAQAALRNDQKQGWALLEHPARLSIRTIDALCAHLVRAMPWLSGLGGVPEVSDQADALYLQAARSTIAMADQSEAVAYLVAHLGVNVPRLEELLVGMLKMRDQWLQTLGSTQQAQQSDLLQEFLAQLVEEQLLYIDEHLPYGWQQTLAPCAVHAHENLADAEQRSPFMALADWDDSNLLQCVPEDLSRWQGLRAFLLSSTGTLRKAGGINARIGLPATGNKQVRQQFQEWLSAQDEAAGWVKALDGLSFLQTAYSAEQMQLLQHLIRVLWLASAQLRLAFIEKGQVDFIEIAQRALDALGSIEDPSDLLLRMDRRVSHLLVDEFQDTSYNQLQLLEKLTSGWQADDGRTVFLVGDPMQSIYRFRKAEVGLFIQIRAQQRLGTVALEAVTLSNNFRSSENVVQWVNELGNVLFPLEANAELGAVQYSPSVAFNASEKHAGVYYHPFIYNDHDEQALDAEQARLQAEQRVVELCASALEHYPNSTKPAAILVRARTHLKGVIRALSLAGIPTKAVDIDHLTARPIVQDIVQLVRALMHSGDRLAWLAVLRSPICGLTLSSLHLLCGHDRQSTLEQLIRVADASQWSEDEWRRLQHVAAVLFDQRHRSGGLPFAAWVEHCWLRLGGGQVYPLARDQADAENVFRLLEKLAPYGNLDIEVFEDQVAQLFAAAQTAERAVEVMTFHKAKGLEFESVILYDLHRESPPQRAPLFSVEQSQGRMYVGMIKASDVDDADPMSQFIQHREKERALFEQQRLLYVGVTRARSQLHLLAMLSVNKKGEVQPTKGTLLELLWPLAESAFQAKEFLPTLQSAPSTPAPYQYLYRVKQVVDLALTSVRIPPPGQNTWQWSEEPFKEAAVGTVAHAWLERIGREGRDVWDGARIEQSAAVIERQLLRAGVGQAEITEAVFEVQDTLVHTLTSERGCWLLDVAQAYREWALLDAEGRVSIIDLAISQQDQWLIVDYKTSRPHEGQSNEAFLAIMRARYEPQLRRYCDQVQAFDGRKAQAALYFPRADLWCEI